MKGADIQTIKSPWYYSRTFVILALLVLGPLGLPFLIKSPKFHPITKSILTIGLILLTFYLITLTIKIANLLYKDAQVLYM